MRPPHYGWLLLILGYLAGLLGTVMVGWRYAAPYRAEAREWKAMYDSVLITRKDGLVRRADVK